MNPGSSDICVIVPTIREWECIRDYAANARRHGFDTDRLFIVLVTEDFCDTVAMERMLEDEELSGAVFDGTARSEWMEHHGISDYEHLIPEASHAQTSFGLLYLWANGFPYGVFIDDDTLPHDDIDFFGRHLRNLNYEGELETVTSDEDWVNVCYQSDSGLYPRGYPYSAMDETVETERRPVSDVVASQGLWTNVPDLDAVRILMDGDLNGQAQTRTTDEDFPRDFVAGEGQYLTVCSMNLAFRREIVPAFYQLPMDDNPWDVGRFDDIWSGLFLKRACDVVGGSIYNGQPLCEHNKAPRSTFSDLTNEANGLELNEHLWRIIDAVDPEEPTYAGVFEAIATRLATGEFDEYQNGAFLSYVGEYMRDWLDCLEALDAPATHRASVPTAGDD